MAGYAKPWTCYADQLSILQKRWNTWSVLAITVFLATGMTCVNGTATQPVSAW